MKQARWMKLSGLSKFRSKGLMAATAIVSLSVVAVTVGHTAWASPSSSKNFGSREFQQAVKDAILSDPEIVQEALNILEDREAAALQKQLEDIPPEYVYGDPHAPITIVEFYDYRCGYCKAAMEWVLKTVDNNKDIKVVFREFPILSTASLDAAKASIAAADQGHFLEFHKLLMNSRGDFSTEHIDDLARKAGIDVKKMRQDMKNPNVNRFLSQNMLLGSQANVNGTPAFFINGIELSGFDPSTLDHAVKKARNKLKNQK